MMRRCLNEAMVCARSRQAFGKTIIEYPLLRRQLLKITLPAEQSLSMFLFAAHTMDRANTGEKDAETLLRILTPLLKFRACRDNIPVATGSMEVRGGNGYIEEWVNARLIRDAHIGVLWEGTSNINALDIITRAVGKSRAHRLLDAALGKLLDQATAIPAIFRDRLRERLNRALTLAERVAAEPRLEEIARTAASALYHVTSAVLMTWEAAQPSADARRALYARLVLDHRLSAQDPLEPASRDWEREAAELIFAERQVLLSEVVPLLQA
jgi:acyl-CoA dehydrogenase